MALVLHLVALMRESNVERSTQRLVVSELHQSALIETSPICRGFRSEGRQRKIST